MVEGGVCLSRQELSVVGQTLQRRSCPTAQFVRYWSDSDCTFAAPLGPNCDVADDPMRRSRGRNDDRNRKPLGFAVMCRTDTADLQSQIGLYSDGVHDDCSTTHEQASHRSIL
jgi:hypothetical protein